MDGRVWTDWTEFGPAKTKTPFNIIYRFNMGSFVGVRLYLSVFTHVLEGLAYELVC